MAVLAAHTTLTGSSADPLDLGEVLHAWTYFQGHDFWSPAHYVAARIGAENAVPIGIQQMCNGGMAAVDAAAGHLLADPAAGPALITTGDRFAPPGFDRWGSDLGVCYGDGATAVVLDRVPRGRAVRLLAVETVAAARLEAMHRGNRPFSPVPRGGTEVLRPALTKRQFAAGPLAADLAKAAYSAIATALGTALAAASVSPDDPRLAGVALPRLSRNGLDEVYRPVVEDSCSAPVLDLGSRTGHLGAGDAMANLTDLLAGNPAPGSVFVLISAGAGFTWSTAVAEVV